MPLLNQKYDFSGMFLLYIRYAKGVYILMYGNRAPRQ